MRIQCYLVLLYWYYKSSDKGLQVVADLGSEGRARMVIKRGDEKKKGTQLGGGRVSKQKFGVHSVRASETRAEYTGPHSNLRAAQLI